MKDPMAICPRDGTKLTYTGQVHPDDLEEATCRTCRHVYWVNQEGGIEKDGEEPPRRTDAPPAPHPLRRRTDRVVWDQGQAPALNCPRCGDRVGMLQGPNNLRHGCCGGCRYEWLELKAPVPEIRS